MMASILNHAPQIGLLLFFIAFVGIAVYVLRPSSKAKLETYAHIPLKEDSHGGQ